MRGGGCDSSRGEQKNRTPPDVIADFRQLRQPPLKSGGKVCAPAGRAGRRPANFQLPDKFQLEGERKIRSPFASLHFFHHLAAAAGDDLAFLHMEDLVADGAINIAFFLCPHHSIKIASQFHWSKFSVNKSHRVPVRGSARCSNFK